jgi:DNA-binding CsgD family transcriptional regulator
MVERKRTRSDIYQSIFFETSYSNDMMEAFCNEDSISARLNPFQYDEDLIDLEEQLKEEFWRIVDTLLTERQREVLKLSAEGLTQCEIAKKLGVNQSSVVKSRMGNACYTVDTNGVKSKKQYGGSQKKLKKLLETDTKILEILDKMASIREEKW